MKKEIVLHDCLIKDIIVKNDSFMLVIIQQDAADMEKYRPITLAFNVLGLNVNTLYSFLEINQIKNNKIKEITFDRFIKIVHEGKVRIYMNYHCDKPKAIAYQFTNSKCDFWLLLSDIEDVTVSY